MMDEEIQRLMAKPELTDDEAVRLSLLLQPEEETEVDNLNPFAKAVGTGIAFAFVLAVSFVVLGGILRVGMWVWP